MHRAVSARPGRHGAGVGPEAARAAGQGRLQQLRRAGRRARRSTARPDPRSCCAGIEAHVCVLHTALDLLALDFRVYVAVDAVGSRYRIDHDVALRRLEKAGAILTTSETCVFEWIGGAGHPQFKAISRLVQERMKQMMISD